MKALALFIMFMTGFLFGLLTEQQGLRSREKRERIEGYGYITIEKRVWDGHLWPLVSDPYNITGKDERGRTLYFDAVHRVPWWVGVGDRVRMTSDWFGHVYIKSKPPQPADVSRAGADIVEQ